MYHFDLAAQLTGKLRVSDHHAVVRLAVDARADERDASGSPRGQPAVGLVDRALVVGGDLGQAFRVQEVHGERGDAPFGQRPHVRAVGARLQRHDAVEVPFLEASLILLGVVLAQVQEVERGVVRRGEESRDHPCVVEAELHLARRQQQPDDAGPTAHEAARGEVRPVPECPGRGAHATDRGRAQAQPGGACQCVRDRGLADARAPRHVRARDPVPTHGDSSHHSGARPARQAAVRRSRRHRPLRRRGVRRMLRA